jgi:hypothetical protein
MTRTTCSNCRGKGAIWTFLLWFLPRRSRCPYCDGTGWTHGSGQTHGWSSSPRQSSYGSTGMWDSVPPAEPGSASEHPLIVDPYAKEGAQPEIQGPPAPDPQEDAAADSSEAGDGDSGTA